MTETLAVSSERVDDIPLLLAQLEHMGVLALLDEHFPTHGNWQGLSLGWVAMIWLTHILSEGDHRLSHVQTWADQRVETLSRSTGKQVQRMTQTLEVKLAKAQGSLAALYKRGRGRKRFTEVKSLRQTSEAIVNRHQVRYHPTPLSDLQHRILELLGFSSNIYTRLCAESPKPP